MPAVLREREFRLYFIGQGVSQYGDRMVNVALAFAVLGLGGDASDVGLVFAARMLPLVACLLAGGVLADRLPRRAIMLATDVLRFGTQGLLAGLLIADAAEIWMLAVLSGLTGAGTGFFSPAMTGLMPALVSPARLQEANGLRAIAASVGEIGGPITAGLLVAAVGAGWALAVDAASFGFSACFLALLRVPAGAERVRQTFLADLRQGWQAFRSLRWVWTFVACAALGNMLWGAWNVLGPVIVDRDYGGAATWGTIVSGMGVGTLFGGVVALRTHPRRPIVFASVWVAFFGTPLALLALGLPALVIAAGAFVSGAGLMVSNTVWESTLQRRVPDAVLSRVSAYDWFGSLAFQPLGLALWGPVAAVIGVSAALWIAFALLVVSSLALLLVREVRELEVAPAPA